MTEKRHDVTRREFVKKAGLGAAALAVASTTPLTLSMASTIKNGMGYRTLGRTGLEISEVSFGAGSLGPSGSNMLRAALSQGVNIIETSSSYLWGQSETAIGKTVKSMGIRDKVFILTKAGRLDHSRLVDAPASEVEKVVRDRLEGSLQRLETDYIDVYLCPHEAKSPNEAAYPALQEVLEKFKKEGKIRYTGLSTHFDYANVCMAAIEGGYYDTLMFPINFSTLHPHIRKAALESKKAGAGATGSRRWRRRGFDRPIIDVREVMRAAQEKNVGVIAMKGAQQGFLPPSIHDQIKGEFAKDTKLSFHQYAYRYVLDQPQVNTVSVRIANILHMEEALVLPQKTLKG